MARERMAKLIKYCHYEAISCHIMTFFMTCQILMHIRELQTLARAHPWPSDDDLAYNMASAASNCTGKNCLSQIECWNLENEAKTTRKLTNLSFNFLLQTSCKLSPYQSLSLSRISSTSHRKQVWGSWRVSAWRNCSNTTIVNPSHAI